MKIFNIKSRDIVEGKPFGTVLKISGIYFFLAIISSVIVPLLTRDTGRFPILPQLFLLIVTVASLILWLAHKMRAYDFTLICCLANVIVVSTEYIMLPIYFPGLTDHTILYVGLVVQSVCAVFISFYFLNKYLTAAIGLTSTASFLIGIAIADNPNLDTVAITNTIILLMVTLASYLSAESLTKITDNYDKINTDQTMMKNFLSMDEDDLHDIIKMGKEHNLSAEDTDKLRQMLSDNTITVQKTISDMVKQENITTNIIASKIPELTPAELEVARLVLMKASLQQMTEALGKNRGNITVLRSNIRKKLNLKREDNLYTALARRIYGM